ncbi:MAG: hypothetical protein Q9216_004410 [Gyalolechia sp. 2 TL-2023]
MKFSWNDASQTPRVVVTAEDPEFDNTTLQDWEAEGFEVSYLPFTTSRKAYVQQFQDLAETLELGENIWRSRRSSPRNGAKADAEPMRARGILSQPSASARGWISAEPEEAEPGFAEHDLDQFDKVSAGLAWSRSLELIRRAFEVEVDLESIWEDHSRLEFATKDAAATMKTMVKEPYVNHIPTMTGGIGHRDLLRFYRDYFIPGNPPSLKMRLISRTVGTNRIVDEMVMSFRHTQEITWVLPGVAPTQKQIEFALVAIVCVRGGKLYHEHIYWDQATVLVQAGLLDPNLSGKGFNRLPVVDGAGARKVIDESSEPSNRLISSW